MKTLLQDANPDNLQTDLEKEKPMLLNALEEIRHLKLGQEGNSGSKAYGFYHSIELILEALDNNLCTQEATNLALEQSMTENKSMRQAFDNMTARVKIMEKLLASFLDIK